MTRTLARMAWLLASSWRSRSKQPTEQDFRLQALSDRVNSLQAQVDYLQSVARYVQRPASFQASRPN